jgi:hypothetical protein
MSSYDRVIAEALNEGMVYADYGVVTPESKAAFNAFADLGGSFGTAPTEFYAGWNACMEYLRTNTNVLGEPKQRHESPHSDDGLPSLGGPEV